MAQGFSIFNHRRKKNNVSRCMFGKTCSNQREQTPVPRSKTSVVKVSTKLVAPQVIRNLTQLEFLFLLLILTTTSIATLHECALLVTALPMSTRLLAQGCITQVNQKSVPVHLPTSCTTTRRLHNSSSLPQLLSHQHSKTSLFPKLFGIDSNRSSVYRLSSSSLGAASPSFSSSTEPTTSDTTESIPSTVFSKSDQKRLLDLMPNYNADGQPYSLYEKCVRRLYLTNLFHPVKMGLQNMKMLHEALGNPMDDVNRTIIHIAGTNGKGSVALKIARTLENAGHRVGLFVSPHISSFRERMQINSQPITEDQVETHLPHIYNLCENGGIPATFFEITTALAFRYFDKGEVDVVVLETGLGGRLDATNVLVRPDLCVVTSIGLEHTRILGDTIEKIAGEKAGIMKKDVPVLVGPNVPHIVMRMHAKEKGVEGYYECEDVLGPVMRSCTGEVDGVEYVDYDVENSRIATAALHLLIKKQTEANCSKCLNPITDANIEMGTSIRPSCRFEVMKCYCTISSDSIVITTSAPTINENDISISSATSKPVTVILDVAHNPPAMDLLTNKLKASYPNNAKRIIAGFSADKDLRQCAQSLLAIVPDPSNIHLVEAAHPRAARIEDMLQAEPKLNESNFDEEDRSIVTQVRSAMRLSCERGETLIICGSVFIMSEVRETLGIEEPRDSKYIAEVAGSGMKSAQDNFGNKDPEAVVVA